MPFFNFERILSLFQISHSATPPVRFCIFLSELASDVTGPVRSGFIQGQYWFAILMTAATRLIVIKMTAKIPLYPYKMRLLIGRRYRGLVRN
jgi:hypothetical protein